MAAIRDRMEDHARRPAIRYTQVIVNHGREAGASLEHPHGQLLGIPVRSRRDRRGGGRVPAVRGLVPALHHAGGRGGRRSPGGLRRRPGRGRVPLLVGRALRDAGAAPRPRRRTSPTRRPPTSPRSGRALRTALASLRAMPGRRGLQPGVPHRAAPPRRPVPLARPRGAPGHERGRVRAGHRRDDRHRRPRAGGQAPQRRRLRLRLWRNRGPSGPLRSSMSGITAESPPPSFLPDRQVVGPAAGHVEAGGHRAGRVAGGGARGQLVPEARRPRRRRPAGRRPGRRRARARSRRGVRARRPRRRPRRACPATPPRAAW